MKTKPTLLFKSAVLLLTIFTCSFFTSCSSNENELKTALDKMETRYENIAQELGIEYWNFYSGEAKADLKTPKDKFYNLLINDTLNLFIETWYPKANEIRDTILRKRVQTWHNVLISAKVEYSKEIMNLRNELEEQLEVSDEMDNSNYDFESNMIKLIELRNKKSFELGYDNYVHLTFETNGLGYDWFMDFVETLESETNKPFKNLIEDTKTQYDIEEFGQMNLMQMVGQFYRNNEPTELKNENNINLVKQSLANIGIEYNQLPSRLVEMELPAGIGGQGLMINIPNDFRAVMTLNMDITVWMHEMGHGLHGLFNSINKPILEGYEWIPGNSTAAFAEGMAETSAWFTRTKAWQKEYTNLTEKQMDEKRAIINKFAPAFIRYHLYFCMSEIDLYLSSEKSFDEIQKDLAKKYFFIDSDEYRTRNFNSIVYVSYPLYLQNYLLADIVASQVHTSLKENFGENYAFNKNVGAYLTKHFYSSGEYYNWNERLIHGTGKPLDLDAYL
ncbi:MAG: hypothetical protein C0597_12020, partial [Marinilabiliales bacterium]